MTLQYHEVFGQWYVPNLRAYVPHERGYYCIKSNREGMRSSRDYSTENSGSKVRILLFGDSFTAGDGVHNEERFSDLLEEMWEEVEVLNFGVNSSGTDQQLLILERLGSRFEGEIVLLCPLVENIRRNVVPYWAAIDRISGRVVLVPKPYFRLEGGCLQLFQVPVPKERPLLSEAPRELRTLFRSLKEEEPSWSDLLKEIGEPLTTAFRRCSRSYQPYPQYDSPRSPEWVLMKVLLEKMIEQAGSRKVVLAPLPSFQYIEGLSPPTYLQRYRELAQGHPEIHFIDLLAYFKPLSPTQKRACRYPHDVHYTPLGHEVVARALVQELRSLISKRQLSGVVS